MSAPVVAKHNISKKRKFVADGVFYAELREFLSKELAEDGFSGVEVRKTPIRTEIIIRATRTMEVLGPNGRRIRELTSLVQKRFGFTEGTVRRHRPATTPPPTHPSPLTPHPSPLTPHPSPLPPIYQVELYAERVNNRGLSACSQAESLKFKLVQVPHHLLFYPHTKPAVLSPQKIARSFLTWPPPPSYQPTAGPRRAPRVLQRAALHHGERCQGRSGDAEAPHTHGCCAPHVTSRHVTSRHVTSRHLTCCR
jgi:hypothetical protein